MCFHYYNRAVNAESTKATLETEQQNLTTEKNNLETEYDEIEIEKQLCVDSSAELITVKRMLDNYANVFRQVGSGCEKVKVNGAAYDKGRCYEIANEIRAISDELGEYQQTILNGIEDMNTRITEIEARIREINTRLGQIIGLISGLDNTISQKYWTCASCRQAIAKQSGIGPVAMAE